MKLFKIIYSPLSHEIISHLSPTVKKPLRQLVENLVENPFLGKQLKDELEGLRSLRFKRHRVIYRINEDSKQIEIIFAGPRADVYQELSRMLKKSRPS